MTAITAWELQCPGDSELTRRFGRHIRLAGGSYNRCANRYATRIIEIPNTPEGHDVYERMVEAGLAPSTLIARGLPSSWPAWIVVMTRRRRSPPPPRTLAEAEEVVARNIANARDRGIKLAGGAA